MSTAPRTAKKPALTAKAAARDLTGQALLNDMQAYRDKVTASPAAARDFLMGLGVLTEQGKSKRLIRG
jgi:transcriptional regulator of met regulon